MKNKAKVAYRTLTRQSWSEKWYNGEKWTDFLSRHLLSIIHYNPKPQEMDSGMNSDQNTVYSVHSFGVWGFRSLNLPFLDL